MKKNNGNKSAQHCEFLNETLSDFDVFDLAENVVTFGILKSPAGHVVTLVVADCADDLKFNFILSRKSALIVGIKYVEYRAYMPEDFDEQITPNLNSRKFKFSRK